MTPLLLLKYLLNAFVDSLKKNWNVEWKHYSHNGSLNQNKVEAREARRIKLS
jgi:hypothetical protein